MISLDDIHAARQRLQGVTTKTPLVQCHDSPNGSDWYFKTENLQPIGAFKLRGGYNKIASLSAAERQRGVVAFSSGNHAQGVAYAARQLGVRAVIVMPARAPEIKKQKTQAMGAEVVIMHEGGEEEWRQKAEALAQQQGLTMVTPFNDETIIAGQATVGLEILEDSPDVQLVLAPIGGGGLISGVASAIKLSRPSVKVIGVESELANTAQLSLRQGQIVSLPIEQTGQTVADGMRSTQIGDITFRYIREYVDDIITVNEQQICNAVRRLALDSRLVAEPSGAVTVAALYDCQDALPPASRTVAIISGGNIDPKQLAEIVSS
jgi:threonine dehydratase